MDYSSSGKELAKLTGGWLLLDHEAADISGESSDAGRLTHVRPRVCVSDVTNNQFRAISNNLVLVNLVERLIIF